MATLNFKAKYGVQVADSQNPSGYDLLPVGTIMYWAGPATQSVDGSGNVTTSGIPAGWLLCDGNAVSRSTYANLHALLVSATPQYPYGNGNGSTTFNLPDCRGRALEQEGFTPTNTNRQLTGAETYTLLDSNIVAHTHTLNTHSHSGLNSHTHPGPTHTHNNGAAHAHLAVHTHSIGDASAAHSHNIFSIATSSTGSGQLRASTAQVTPVNTMTTAQMPHSHASSGDSGNLNSGGVAFSTPGVTVSTTTSADSNSSTGGSSTANTGFNGSSTRSSISLMQPFVVLHVIIKA